MATSAVASHNPLVSHQHRSRASSTKFSMVSSSLESNSTARSASTNTRAGGKLYRQITPRKKIDRFGVDKTDYKAYFLSSTVFPTGVRATLLAEMQEDNPHTCGFDIVERRSSDSGKGDHQNGHGDLTMTNTATASTTRTHSALNAPPPTAVPSMTDRSMQSAPVVAINILERSNLTPDDSHHEKDRRGSSVYSREKLSTANTLKKKNSSSANGDTTAASSTEKGGGVSLEVNGGGENPEKSYEFTLEDKALDEKARTQIESIKRRLEAEKQYRQRKPKSRAIPRLTAFSSADGSRLINYHWMSREDRLALEREAGEDIRDPLYLNTFFPEERPVRFHKTTLPTVRRSAQRARPWTVTEKTVNARAAAAATLKSSILKPAKSAGTYKSTSFAVTGPARAAARSTGTVARRSVGGWRGQANVRNDGGYNEDGNDYYYDEDDDDDEFDDEDEYFYDDNGGIRRLRRRGRRGPLLEVRPFLAGGADAEGSPALGDQRSKLRGKDGCLNSRVKQCVRFVRYRERLDRQGDDRPLKAEAGRYRPMSKTDIADHRPPNPPPSPEQKMQRSVDAYRKYVDNIAIQTKYVASKSTGGKYQTPQPSSAFKNTSLAPTSSRLQTRNGTTLASNTHQAGILETDSIRSVMDSNLPDMSDSAGGIATTPGRHSSSAIYTKDASDVSQALAIRRISPKLSSNRIVAGTRGVVAQDQSPGSARREKEETPHWATIDSDDGEDMFEGTPTNAIVVPQATKSECLSEYSAVVDSTVVDKEDRT